MRGHAPRPGPPPATTRWQLTRTPHASAMAAAAHLHTCVFLALIRQHVGADFLQHQLKRIIFLTTARRWRRPHLHGTRSQELAHGHKSLSSEQGTVLIAKCHIQPASQPAATTAPSVTMRGAGVKPVTGATASSGAGEGAGAGAGAGAGSSSDEAGQIEPAYAPGQRVECEWTDGTSRALCALRVWGRLLCVA